MPRYKREEIEQGEIMTVYLSQQFDEFSNEYIIKEYVENNIDELVFKKYYQNDEKGRKAKHPKDMLSGILYGYFNGIPSSRKLEELLKHHIAYKFVTNKLGADHSVLCDFKNKCREEVESMFSRLLYVLNEMGGIDFERIIGDGTLIDGQAWKELTVEAKTIDEKIKRYSELSKKIVERDIENEKSFNDGAKNKEQYSDEKNRIDRQKRKYGNIVNKLKEYEDALKSKKIDPNTKYNLTDPDSSLLVKSRGKQVKQGYNAKMMISNNDVILSIDCKNNHERNSTTSMVQGVEQLKNDLGIEKQSKYLFDSNFFDIHKIFELEDVGADMYIENKVRDFSDASIKRKYFQIEKEKEDYYLQCIGNRRIKGKSYTDCKGVERYYFEFAQKHCSGCNNIHTCFENVKTKRKVKRVQFEVFELNNKERIESYLDKIKSHEGRVEYNRRIGKEHVFANIKNQKNHFRTFYKGIVSVHMDMLLTAISHNLAKYVNILKMQRQILAE
jgi:transposase